jgi:uncharacterized membrane protein
MAQSHILVGVSEAAPDPVVRRIKASDLMEALSKGWADFAAMPSHAVFLCVIYPLIGLVLAGLTLGQALVPLVFPIAAGFALVGPIAALGLYELSRRREAGLDVTASDAFEVLRSPSIGAIVALGLGLMAWFLIWVAVANAIYTTYFGYGSPASIEQFLRDLFTTSAGWKLILVGNAVGFLFAVAVLSMNVVTFPLLLDREVGAMVAVLTSLRAVIANPVTMAMWGVIVAGLLLLASIPLFLALPVVLPVLGHASWHLYRKVVVADASPRADFRPRPQGKHYAADFPVSLLPGTRQTPPA